MVVTDINMPRMDGLSLLQKLQENEERGLDHYRLGLWRHGQHPHCMNRGAFDFVTKPIDTHAELDSWTFTDMSLEDICTETCQRIEHADKAARRAFLERVCRGPDQQG